jgi:hypothetical protein
VGDGAIAAGWANNHVKVYNNTFVNGGPNSPTVSFPQAEAGYTGIGNEAYNNLTVGCKVVSYKGAGVFGNNSSEGSAVFVNYMGGDYRLAKHTAAGRMLPAPYDTDIAGNSRGSGGVWDVGAHQYSIPVTSVSPTLLDFGIVRTNSSRELVLTVRNTGGGLLAGTVSVGLPFFVVSGRDYTLAAGQAQSVTVRYIPAQLGSNSQKIICSGGGGAVALANGAGSP